MKRFNITKNDTVCILGKRLPKGAMYGEDKYGIWLCIDYRIKKVKQISHAHYIHTVNGESILVSPPKTKPYLALLRPEKRDATKQSGYENRIKWLKSLECGETVNKILELVDRYPQQTEICYNQRYKTICDVKNGILIQKKAPVCSNKDVSAVSQNPDGRGIKEFVPHAMMFGLTKPKPVEYAIPTGRFVNPETYEEDRKILREMVEKIASR